MNTGFNSEPGVLGFTCPNILTQSSEWPVLYSTPAVATEPAWWDSQWNYETELW